MPKRTLAERSTGNISVNITTLSLKENRKKGKKDKKETNHNENNMGSKSDSAAQKAARREKKRLKKLKLTVLEASESNDLNGVQEDVDTSLSEAKAIKKAEKARLKALKKRKDEEKFGEQDAAVSGPTLVLSATGLVSRYTEHSELALLPQAEIDSFLADNFISITDPIPSSPTLRPLTQFSYLHITNPAELIPFKNFKAPTPIQAAAWPYLFAGRDVIGVAETGSGKTMAFAVPCVRKICELPSIQRDRGARAVVVSPTRELAIQTYDQIMQLCKLSGLKAVCVYGGVPKDEQRKSLKTADIVVATPGRLNDFINEGCANLAQAEYVVLDEADRMLDKGFEEEIKKIINTTPPVGKRQTLMFTATWPESVRTLASTFMLNPIKIVIGDNPTGDLRANARIVQKVEVVDPRNKEFRLLQILKQYQSGSQKHDRILVFALYKKEATRLESFIRSKGFQVAGIHGDLSQEQRTRSLEAFKQGQTPILVATDVAARGLDIPDVQLVCNCTFPLTIEDYVHRIGRTGRAGKGGLAITLFTEHDKSQSGALINVLKAANQIVPEELLKFGTTVKRKEHEAYGAFAKDVDMTKTAKKIRFD